MTNETKQVYPVGQRVVGTVDKLLPYGVFVRLDDGPRAYLRRREMSWTGDSDPRELVQVGQRIEAVIVHLGGADRSMELSLRAALPDPWEGFIHRFQNGDLVAGTVRSLARFGVFVQILPGVDGLVPLRELAPWPVEKPEDVVWVGDDVEAVITRIDHKARKVWLSIRARLRQRETAAAILRELHRTAEKGVQPELHSEALSPGMTDDDLIPEAIDSSVIERVGRILMVEDEDQVRLPLAARPMQPRTRRRPRRESTSSRMGYYWWIFTCRGEMAWTSSGRSGNRGAMRSGLL
jgi:predicted RNA-binding protein with RPS1 domain